MMKLVNRLLVIAVIAFGSWFLVQQWDKVEGEHSLVTEVTEVEVDGEEIVEDDETLLIFENTDPIEETVRKIQPVVKVAPTNSITATKIVPSAKVVASATTTDITVYLYEGGFDISAMLVPEGTINFNVRNDGRMSHEFAIEGLEDFGRVIPGENKTFTLTLSAGEYELFSPRAVDQTLNMRETLIVENAK